MTPSNWNLELLIPTPHRLTGNNGGFTGNFSNIDLEIIEYSEPGSYSKTTFCSPILVLNNIRLALSMFTVSRIIFVFPKLCH